LPYLEVMTTQPSAPGWVLSWCAKSGTDVALRQLPRCPQPWPPMALLDKVTTANDHMVLIDRHAPRHSGTRSVMVALRNLDEDDDVLVAAVGAALELGADLDIRHAVPLPFGGSSVGLAEALRRARELLAQAAARATALAPRLRVSTGLYRMRAEELVGDAVDVELLVVGRARRWGGRHQGLVTASAVISGRCALLLVPRQP
jgi:nucleotide-binding universal stress UspA family protein